MPDRITRADLEESFRGVGRSASGALGAVRPAFPGLVGIAAGALVVIAFAIGYRRGKVRSAVIEITRI
jgi:hypothetical protein